ncbi:acyl-CoA dehydrogenase [Streptomyces sp. S.PNR 29]|uniref:acyl-CoA dehydrogenase n=1 Tax=Streptomyces sp. S.PNR 29 TaxID=2973805 RepID=UPI0025AF25BF|nr:acyl-CoA dehydrogenase [Streptomyces sp. S.PNR 29]MDN0197928.1 acyl-CoA dehydrogenase [Streptomyces sp. S.PNR 29]
MALTTFALPTNEAAARPRAQAAALNSEAAVAGRVADLERRFGDPWDAANPLGHAAILAADERGLPQAQAEQLLDGFGLNAEFVPAALGGRLVRADTLARVLRAVFRRDQALGTGYGAFSVLAGASVWVAGSSAQQRWAADVLLGGGRLAVSYRELAHGNAFLRDEFTLSAGAGGGLVLDGTKRVIINADRARGLVIVCRSSRDSGSQSHSTLLLDRQALPAGRVRDLQRYPMVGMRGCRMTGLQFTHCPVPEHSMLGQEGGGVDLALRSFAFTRSILPSMVLGGGDTALRTALRFADVHGVGGRPVQRNPQARRTLSGAFSDLLICDSLALASTRAAGLHLGITGVYAAATKYLLPILLHDAVHELSVLLGSAIYVRDGEFGIFQKHVRDLPVTSLGHAGAAAALSTITPELSALARRSWLTDTPSHARLFKVRDDLPVLDFARLSTAAAGDPLCAELVAAAEDIETGPDSPCTAQLRPITRHLVGELRRLREACAALAPLSRHSLANPHTYALADRYTLILAAAACLGVWRHQQHSQDTFLAGSGWLVTALLRICTRLGLGTPATAPGPEAEVFAELSRRFTQAASFDLYDTPLAAR